MFIRSGYSAHTRSTRGERGEGVSRTQHHHRAARVLVGSRNLARGLHAQAGGGALALQLARAEALQSDHIAFGSPLQPAPGGWLLSGAASGRLEDATLAFDHDLPPAHGDTGGPARV